jgi:homoserine dehydrogenase
MKVVLIGFGAVGQGLAGLLRDKASELKANQNFEAKIVGVGTRTRGSLYRADGLSIDGLFAALERGSLKQYPDEPGLQRDWGALRLVRESSADAMVETTYTNLQTAQPALDYCHAAFDTGKHVVLANKGPVALAYEDLTRRARNAGKLLRFEATVMSGTPTLRLGMQGLAGCTISEARGILNGTTNYILTQMEDGMSYADALAQAQALGYAEADPTADVDGWDAAAKALILAQALFKTRLTLQDMDVKGISGITLKDVITATKAGERWKLIARVTPDGGSVQPTRIPISHPLAGVSGTTNAVTFSTDLLGDVTLIGRGAGGQPTGFGLLSDLLEIHRSMRAAAGDHIE